MRRTILMALLAALLLAPAASADGNRAAILRDCNDDGVLQGDYSATQMRDARNNIPTDMQEYSDCYDVLTRAISKETAPKADDSSLDSTGGTTGSTGSSGGTGGASTDSGGTTTDPGVTSEPAPEATSDDGRQLPQTPQEWQAITEAQKQGPDVTKDLKQVSPGAKLTAEVGRNGVPGMLVGVLALIAAAALALVAAPMIRKRGLGPRT